MKEKELASKAASAFGRLGGRAVVEKRGAAHMKRIGLKGVAKMKDAAPELLTLQEACKLLQCHPNTLRAWDRKGILKARRIGHRKDRRYKKEDVMRLKNNLP